MVSINYSSREVCCKIVYYGPGLSGKTTNLQYIHSKVPQTTRGKLISLATEADRTLFFDFLPINIGNINGLAAKFQLYTVPGQVYYNATRKLVLRGVDGICFVADSQPDKMDENIESLTNLADNLIEYGYDINTMPIVIQYNKRDLPGVMSIEEIQQKLNPNNWPYFEASATIGTGVFDTLKLIIKMVLAKAKNPNAAASSLVASSTTTSQSATATPAEVASPPPEGPAASPVATSPPVTTASQPAGATATAVVNKPRQQEQPEPSSNVQFRPFPGTQGETHKEKKLSPSSFTPPQTDNIDSSGLEKNVIKREYGDSDNNDVSNKPTMAPSLKKKREVRKRGFFKRLFGIR